LVDGEHAGAALGAADTANQPRAASLEGIGQRCIHDLDELLVARA
jgi:hypothetical protein